MLLSKQQKKLFPLAAVILALITFFPVAAGCGDEEESQSEIDIWISQLASEDEAERQQAMDSLVQAGEPAVEPVIAVFVSEEQALPALKGASSVLEQIGEPAVQPLIDSFAYTGEKRATAIAWKKNTLVAIGEPAIEPLTAALENEDPAVREAAADTLGDIGDSRAVDPLARALDDEDDAVREAAAEALGAIADPQAIPPLTDALDDEKRAVRQAVRDALTRIHAAVGDTPELQAAFDRCVAVEVAPITDPYGLVIDENGKMVNPEVLFGLADDNKLYILSILGDCVRIIQ